MTLGRVRRAGESAENDVGTTWKAFWMELEGRLESYDGGLDGGIRGSLFLTDNNDIEFTGTAPGPGEGSSLVGVELHGDIGYGFKLSDRCLVTALAGLGYRSLTWQWNFESAFLLSGDYEDYEDNHICYADFGCRLNWRVHDNVSWTARGTAGPILHNSCRTSWWGRDDGDGGWVMRVETDLEWHVDAGDSAGLIIGCSWYREEQDEIGGMNEVRLEAVTFHLGLRVTW